MNKYVIVGGVAGGATAAARLRRIDEQATIILIEKGHYISYANCGLPYYIGGTIAERERLFVQTPEQFSRRFNIDIRTEQEVVGIDTAAKTVRVRRNGEEYEETYDRLLLSPGASPVRPPLPGIDDKAVFTLRNVEDTDAIKAFIGENGVRRAVVVGGGFIGLEMAENLHDAGIAVTIVEMGNQVMAPVDFSIAAFVHRHLTDKGVALQLEKGVERFERTDKGLSAVLSSGERIETDMVLLSIGVRPNTTLAAQAGLEIGERGIRVNEYLQTSAKDVYAIGDAIEFAHPLTQSPWCNFLAGPANRQGRIVADNMSGLPPTSYEGAIGTAIAKVFDLTVGATGLPAKMLRRMNVPALSSTTISSSHAGYYPGASLVTTKITFEPGTGRLLGAQCVGTDGVDKRIDQLALLIKKGGTVADLTRLEHAYAPPYSSAKDPIAIAGYVAQNILSGAMTPIYWREVEQARQEGAFFLDVRTELEASIGTIEGAVSIPLDELRERISEVPKDRPVVIFCAVGQRGYLAQRILRGNGYENTRNLVGGYRLYEMATSPVAAPAVACGAPKAATAAPADANCEMVQVDACGLQCPGPILRVKKTMDGLAEGACLQATATDPAFTRDAEAWCRTTGNSFVSCSAEGGRYTVVMKKGATEAQTALPTAAPAQGGNKTLIMFSDSLDRAIATFVLANGAAATGKKVSIFFTFWGLNLLKKQHKPAVKKDFISRMFSWMLPAHSGQLHLSKLSFFGAGDWLMRRIMRDKNIESLESLRQQALDNGVEFIACNMTMDMMGIAREELIDGVEIGGVATYMERAENANVNLFI